MQKAISHFKNHLKWYFLLSLFLVSVIVWLAVLREDRNGELKFVVLDVGQGDALFIESPTGVQVLIDGGPNNTLMREISKVMPWYDRHIDILVVTNPDRDHYEGFISLLNKYSVDIFLKSGTDQESSLYQSFEQKIEQKGVKEVVALRGQIVNIGGGAYLQVLFPDREVTGLSSNDGSIVMQLVYGETKVMLQGDSTARIENYLVGLDKNNLKSTILKTGHHGSKTSTTEEYVKAVDPEWAVISAGKNNTYGHPHEEVLDVLNKFNVEVLGTYDLGRITFVSDGINFVQR
jgi:competence protein ComEC